MADNQNYLLNLLKTAASQEGFTLEKLNARYKKHYFQVDRLHGDRCVDDRRPKNDLGNQYLFDKGKYNGRQFAGGSLGVLGALRIAAGMGEENAKALLLAVYKKNNFRLGDHIDDKHGEISDPLKLMARNLGCGNQDKIKAGELKIYADLVQPQMVDKRFNWLRRNNGYIPVLTGHHDATQAVVNLIANTTYNNNQAVEQKASVFNLDLAEAFSIAKLLFPAWEEKTLNESEFVEKFVQTIIRDYLQTLKALSPIRKIQVRK